MSEVEYRDVGLSGIAVLPNRMRSLRPEIVKELAASIADQGLLQPILLRPHQSIGYYLMAGRHRLEAVRSLGWQAIPARIFKDRDADQALLAEIDENLIRANLSPAEAAAHHAAREKVYVELHPETKHGGAPGAGKGKGKKRWKDAGSASFQTDTAQKTGKSRRAVSASTRRGKRIPDVNELAGTSLDKTEELDALIEIGELDPKELDDLKRRAIEEQSKPVGEREKISARTRLKQIKREIREQELAQKIVALPDIKFGVIVEDFEWDFQVYSRETGMDRHAANHYPVSEIAHTAAEIHEYTKERFANAAADCVLFMWATVPYLAVAIEVMRMRGFRYVSNYVWAKDHAAHGYWNRNKHEHLLIGTQGHVVAPAPGMQRHSFIEAPVGEHSAKPAEFMIMIEEYFPNIPKLELNCRGTPRPGWSGWGLETEKEAIYA